MSTGLEGFQRQLKKAMRGARKGAERGVAQAAKILAAQIEKNAPVDTGALRDSVHVEPGKHSTKSITDYVVVAGGHADDPELAEQIEYGTQFEPPHPFIRRSITQTKKRMKAVIKAAILDRIG